MPLAQHSPRDRPFAPVQDLNLQAVNAARCAKLVARRELARLNRERAQQPSGLPHSVHLESSARPPITRARSASPRLGPRGEAAGPQSQVFADPPPLHEVRWDSGSVSPAQSHNKLVREQEKTRTRRQKDLASGEAFRQAQEKAAREPQPPLPSRGKLPGEHNPGASRSPVFTAAHPSDLINPSARSTSPPFRLFQEGSEAEPPMISEKPGRNPFVPRPAASPERCDVAAGRPSGLPRDDKGKRRVRSVSPTGGRSPLSNIRLPEIAAGVSPEYVEYGPEAGASTDFLARSASPDYMGSRSPGQFRPEGRFFDILAPTTRSPRDNNPRTVTVDSTPAALLLPQIPVFVNEDREQQCARTPVEATAHGRRSPRTRSPRTRSPKVRQEQKIAGLRPIEGSPRAATPQLELAQRVHSRGGSRAQSPVYPMQIPLGGDEKAVYPVRVLSDSERQSALQLLEEKISEIEKSGPSNSEWTREKCLAAIKMLKAEKVFVVDDGTNRENAV